MSLPLPPIPHPQCCPPVSTLISSPQRMAETSQVASPRSASLLLVQVIHSYHGSDSVSYGFENFAGPWAGCGILGLKSLA